MIKDKIHFNPPKRHWVLDGCSLDNFNAKLPLEKKTLAFMREIDKDSPLGAYIYGGFGNGKTHLLVGIARNLKQGKRRVAYANGRNGEFLGIIQDSLYDYVPENPLTKSQVLIIDDMDIKDNSLAQSELLYRLLLEQYDKGHPLIISSNYSPEDLVKKMKVKADEEIIQGGINTKVLDRFKGDKELQECILERLLSMCLFIDFRNIPSKRKEKQEEYQKRFL